MLTIHVDRVRRMLWRVAARYKLHAQLLVVIAVSFSAGWAINGITATRVLANPRIIVVRPPVRLAPQPAPVFPLPTWASLEWPLPETMPSLAVIPPQPERALGQVRMLACLKPAMRDVFDRIEQLFGRVDVISTCNHSLYVAGTNRVSRHVSGQAVDFLAGARKQAVVAWLVKNHKAGGTMTYSGSSHIHVDVGPHFVILAGERRQARHTRRETDDDG